MGSIAGKGAAAGGCAVVGGGVIGGAGVRDMSVGSTAVKGMVVAVGRRMVEAGVGVALGLGLELGGVLGLSLNFETATCRNAIQKKHGCGGFVRLVYFGGESNQGVNRASCLAQHQRLGGKWGGESGRGGRRCVLFLL